VHRGETTMCSDKDNRKEIITTHIESLGDGLAAIQESKGHIKGDIEAGKTSLEYLDRAEYEMRKEADLLKTLNLDKVNEVDEPTWKSYEHQYDKTRNLCASIVDYRDNLRERDSTLSPTLSSNFAINASSVSPTVYVLFDQTPVETGEFKSTAAKHEIEQHPVRLFDFVHTELYKIDMDQAELFQKLVREFRAAATDIQYARLIDVRSLIFDQIFETLCPESDYAKTDWFHSAAPGTVEKRKRYCQPQYFILGNTVFSTLDPIIQNRINSVCKDMFDLFKGLSNYGKHGIDDRQTQVFLNETIGTFSEVLQLRDSIHS